MTPINASAQPVKQFITPSGSLIVYAVAIVLFLFLTIGVLIFLAYTTIAVFYPYPLDYGEAPLLDQAMRLATGQNIYRSNLTTPPYTISNYPPLYVAVLAPFVTVFGPSFFFGRVISTLSAVATAIFLALIIHGRTKDRLAAVITAMIFLTIPYVTHWSSLLRIDLVALALSAAALYILVRWPTEQRATVTAALLLAAAICTRHSYALAAPLAGFIWLSRYDWRQALTLAVLTGGTAGFLFLAFNALSQGGFFFNIVTANVNEFGVERLAWNLGRLREAAPVLLALGGVFLIVGPWWERAWSLLVPYSIGAFLSALTIGKIGSNVNYFLEVTAALSLAAGAFIAWTGRRLWLRAALLLLLTWQSGQLILTTLAEFAVPLASRLKDTAAIEEMAQMVAETGGPVLADEYMGLITLQDQPLYIQPFEVTQLAEAGLWEQRALVENILNQAFPLILIYHHPDFPLHAERWTPQMLVAIERRYSLAKVLADTYIYRPRSTRAQAVDAGSLLCPAAPWQLPTTSQLGITWRENSLDFLGQSPEERIPVYAVAGGRLMRLVSWENTIAILHDDPLQPGKQVWSVYADMADADGDSFIVPDFPPGSSDAPVKTGQLLGYQGTWSGRPFWPGQTHLRFSIVEAEEGQSLAQVMDTNALDPSPYLGIDGRASVKGALEQLRCREP
jgi:hypothetical protein